MTRTTEEVLWNLKQPQEGEPFYSVTRKSSMHEQGQNSMMGNSNDNDRMRRPKQLARSMQSTLQTKGSVNESSGKGRFLFPYDIPEGTIKPQSNSWKNVSIPKVEPVLLSLESSSNEEEDTVDIEGLEEFTKVNSSWYP